MKPNKPITHHNLENILTDRALFGMAEQDLRRGTKPDSKNARVPAGVFPHGRDYLEVLASITGEEPDRHVTTPGEECCRCDENREALKARLEYQQTRNAEITKLASDPTSLYTDVPYSLHALWPRNPGESPSQRQITIACWSAYVSMLAGEGYVDSLGRLLEPTVKGILVSRNIDDFEHLEVQARNPENNKKPVTEEYGVDGKRLPRKRLSSDSVVNQLSYATNSTLLKMLICIRDLNATVDLNNPATHIHGLPIPKSITTSAEKFKQLEKIRVSTERKYKLKMPTDFKKHAPKLYEQLVLDLDGTGRNLRVVTVTGFRKNEKGFIVDKGMKVAWSGKPKSCINPDTMIRRDNKELQARRRECATSMLEVVDWGQFQTNMLDSIVATVTSYKAQMTSIWESRKKQKALQCQEKVEVNNNRKSAKHAKNKRNRHTYGK